MAALRMVGLAGALALSLAPSRAPATGFRAANLAENPAAICLAAGDRAADAHGVPRAVMRALTRTETGRSSGGALQPWPWTVNMEGAGHWFDSRAAALAYVAREQARGARSFDVGCFQLNHRWHGQAFASVEAMFDPAANADYAARFLKGLHDESGAWDAAAGLYHSRTPEFRDRYAARFARILRRGDAETAPVTLAALESADAQAAARQPAPRRRRDRIRPLMLRTSWTPPNAQAVTAGGVSLRILRGGSAGLRGGGAALVSAGAQPLLRAARPLID